MYSAGARSHAALCVSLFACVCALSALCVRSASVCVALSGLYVCVSHLCVLECLCDLPLPDVVQEGQAVQLEPRQHRGEEEAEAFSGFEGEHEAQ